MYICTYVYNVYVKLEGKALPLQACTGLEGG
jgi:hypothetical protein